jgi:hypothetical protein
VVGVFLPSLCRSLRVSTTHSDFLPSFPCIAAASFSELLDVSHVCSSLGISSRSDLTTVPTKSKNKVVHFRVEAI